MLAMVVNDTAGSLAPRGVLTTIASKPAPAVGQGNARAQKNPLCTIGQMMGTDSASGFGKATQASLPEPDSGVIRTWLQHPVAGC
ncbi:hypothetical protein EQV97_06155 [Pseudomonas sp. TMW22090]|nr:hypothetical protein [Pseudomonas sp. TMW22090]